MTYTIPADAVFPLKVTMTTASNTGNGTAVLGDVLGIEYAVAAHGAFLTLTYLVRFADGLVTRV